MARTRHAHLPLQPLALKYLKGIWHEWNLLKEVVVERHVLAALGRAHQRGCCLEVGQGGEGNPGALRGCAADTESAYPH
jgi:hypothetical protein